MTAKTRLGLDGYGVRRYGSFASKTPSASGHPVGIITKLALEGYGVRRGSSFAGKTPSGGGGGAHPVGIVTRLALDGYGAKRYGTFANKTTGAVVIKPAVGGGSGRTRRITRSEFERTLQAQRDSTFSRRRWDELLAAEKSAKAAANRAKGEDKRRALQQAANAVELLVDEIAEIGVIPEGVAELSSELVKAARRQSSLTAALRATNTANKILADLIANDDEEIILLLLS